MKDSHCRLPLLLARDLLSRRLACRARLCSRHTALQQAAIFRWTEAGLFGRRAPCPYVPILLQLLEGSKHCMPVAANQLNCLGNVLRELSQLGFLDCCLLLLLKLLCWGRTLCIQPCLILLGIPKNLMSPHWHLDSHAREKCRPM